MKYTVEQNINLSSVQETDKIEKGKMFLKNGFLKHEENYLQEKLNNPAKNLYFSGYVRRQYFISECLPADETCSSKSRGFVLSIIQYYFRN